MCRKDIRLLRQVLCCSTYVICEWMNEWMNDYSFCSDMRASKDYGFTCCLIPCTVRVSNVHESVHHHAWCLTLLPVCVWSGSIVLKTLKLRWNRRCRQEGRDHSFSFTWQLHTACKWLEPSDVTSTLAPELWYFFSGMLAHAPKLRRLILWFPSNRIKQEYKTTRGQGLQS